MKSREIALIGIMLALSLMLNVSPLKVPTQWGMTIDLVAIPVVVVYLLLGYTSSLISLALLFVGLSIVSPASWLGASMKFFATLCVILGMEIAKKLTNFNPESYTGRRLIAFILSAYLISIAIRIPLMVGLNYY
ncbi:MAG TPA: hypothetical protein EYH13_04400, partial [Thermococcus paralvinellae]|nr:hypothetical protein [Thermococcus paralvinellae]